MAHKTKTRPIRVPVDIHNILKVKMPDFDDATRMRILFDTSAIKFDNWLAQPFIPKKKKR